METNTAAKLIWDYMLMQHSLKKADVIMVLGNNDIRVAERAAHLYLDGWAPKMLFCGSGSIHNHKPGRERFIGTTEAEVFRRVAIGMGVPETDIIIENESQNTGENIRHGIIVFGEENINPCTIIIVQKPYMERRAFATAKFWLPDTEIMVTSPDITFENYPNEVMNRSQVINALVGDVQRIKEYPKKRFQIPQDIPDDVWKAYEFLVAQGYVERLTK